MAEERSRQVFELVKDRTMNVASLKTPNWVSRWWTKTSIITFILIVLCGFTLNKCGSAQQFSFKTFNAKDDLLNTTYSRLNIPNSLTCGIGPFVYEKRPPDIEVFPEKVVAHVGDKVELRFDASTICHGQTVTDPTGIEFGNPGMGRLGYIEWEPGVVQNLPNFYGIASFNAGYSQPRSGSIRVYIDLRCAVPKKNFACTFSRSIPITIVAKGAGLKESSTKSK